MKFKIVLFFLVIVVTIIFVFNLKNKTSSIPVLHLNNKEIPLVVVDTPETRERGLSGRENLSEYSAMFFVFDRPDRYAFWMKDMNFPIDIIWLDEKFKIIHIESAIFPQTYPKTFEPTEKNLYVLETNAHFAEKNNLKVGDILKIDLLK